MARNRGLPGEQPVDGGLRHPSRPGNPRAGPPSPDEGTQVRHHAVCRDAGRLPPALSQENPAAFAIAAGIGQPAHAAFLSLLRALSRRQWVRHAATMSGDRSPAW
ncbi:hypothetical protein P1312_085 [Thermobifida phage P1312]|nr:hypothetical protein P1312_085 [Thermobifida phage P1312]